MTFAHDKKKTKERKRKKEILWDRGDTTFTQPRMWGEISIANTCTKFTLTPKNCKSHSFVRVHHPEINGINT